MYLMNPYDSALRQILEEGESKTNKRTGQKTLSVPLITCRYDLRQGFPIINKRYLNIRPIIAETLWFLEGSSNLNRLKELGCNYWEPWRSKEFEEKWHYQDGDLGPVYGFQLRNYNGYYYEDENGREGIDQLAQLLEAIREDYSDRGLIVDLWCPDMVDMGRLRPCANRFKITINDNGDMDLILGQRSCDFPVGIPANIVFYSIILLLIARHTGYNARHLYHECEDAHIYLNQVEAVEEYLEMPHYKNPTLTIRERPSIMDYRIEDFQLNDYRSGPKMKIEVCI
jgi:thymidylate synthase